ncbi:MAG: PIN domain-containing protein [Candidatus Latescibacteria bacterium]|nr:PIN domain-containing protein [Candidatus Latescibacterota bacterium]
MNAILLDTSVVSLLHPKKKQTDLRTQYAAHLAGKIPALSFQSVAELWAWAEHNGWGQQAKSQLDAFIQGFLVIPYNYTLAKIWGESSALCSQQGRTLGAGDIWIAATAVQYRMPLLTHDRDFVGVEIPHLDVISYIGQGKAG